MCYAELHKWQELMTFDRDLDPESYYHAFPLFLVVVSVMAVHRFVLCQVMEDQINIK